MSTEFDPVVRMIPISQIHVLNPRERGRKKFELIVANIAKLGLKKPVTVSQSEGKDGGTRYDLVCGQGRFLAYQSLGQTEIPAIVVAGPREDMMLMSLAENLARRSHTTVELLREINALKERGNSHAEIARKTDLSPTYVRGVLQLLDRGEDRLLNAVEKGQLPLNIAIMITTSDDKSIQKALQEAYEKNDLRGKAFLRARRLIETRRTKGKRLRSAKRATGAPVSTESLMKAFQQETLRQKLVVQQAKACETRLLFAVAALKQLFQDDHFVTLLRAEGLNSLPQFLGEQIYPENGNVS